MGSNTVKAAQSSRMEEPRLLRQKTFNLGSSVRVLDTNRQQIEPEKLEKLKESLKRRTVVGNGRLSLALPELLVASTTALDRKKSA